MRWERRWKRGAGNGSGNGDAHEVMVAPLVAIKIGEVGRNEEERRMILSRTRGRMYT